MPDSFLDTNERRKAINLLAGLYDFTDLGPRGRRVFLQEAAGLGRFVSGVDFSGTPRTVAGDIVGRLERFGQLPERPQYHALGALFTAMLSLGELPPADAASIARLIVRYELVADGEYLQTLRSQYTIEDPSVRKPDARVIGPPKGVPDAPPDPTFHAHVSDEQGLEAIINSQDNFLDMHLLTGALYCSKAVGRVEVPEGTARGTGFLVGPDLLLTNEHVLRSQAELEVAVVRFDYVNDPAGIAGKGTVVPITSDFYASSPEGELDYALVRLASAPLQSIVANKDEGSATISELAATGRHRGYLSLVPRLVIEGSRVNIVQHPAGNPLKVVLTQNYVAYVTDRRVQYIADTMDGSSGSPVFNGNWEVVALHHSGSPYPPNTARDVTKKLWKGRFRVNEGIAMRAILEDLKKKKLDRHLPAS